MLKSKISRTSYIIAVALLLSSCASFKKNTKTTSIPATELTPATKITPAASNNTTGKIKTVKSEQFNMLLLLDEIQLVDVRTKEEFKSGHIKNALNIDVKDVNFKSYTNNLKKDKPVLVYCRSGKRSSEAAEILKELGFTKIVSLEGGIVSWEEADLPISK